MWGRHSHAFVLCQFHTTSALTLYNARLWFCYSATEKTNLTRFTCSDGVPRYWSIRTRNTSYSYSLYLNHWASCVCLTPHRKGFWFCANTYPETNCEQVVQTAPVAAGLPHRYRWAIRCTTGPQPHGRSTSTEGYATCNKTWRHA